MAPDITDQMDAITARVVGREGYVVEGAGMNAHVQNPSPLAVTDPNVRRQLQFAGLRFMITRAIWLQSEATHLGKALKAGEITSDEVDAKLAEMGALDLVYPELMGAANE